MYVFISSDAYEGIALPKAVVEVRKGTGKLTMVPQSLPLRDFDSVSSCSRTGKQLIKTVLDTFCVL